MAIEVIMPKAGVSMEEGTISCWLKEVGEQVNIGDPLIEIYTDKVNMEIEAEGSGILAATLYEDGDALPVFTVIGVLAEEGEDVEEVRQKYLGSKGSICSKIGLEVEEVKEAENEKNDAESEKVKEVKDYDVIVVGGGPGGYIAAIKSAMLGGKVAVVEESVLGGACLNRGCIPTKTYLRNVELLEDIKELSSRGIKIKIESENLSKTIKYKKRVVKKLTAGVEGLLKSHNIDIFNSRASVKKAQEVILDNEKILTTNNIILANGCKSGKLPIDITSSLIINTEQALDLEDVPKELIIVGNDYIACEFAEIFNSRGSKVTIVTNNAKLIEDMDKELRESLKDSFDNKKIKIIEDKPIKNIKEENEKILISLQNNEKVSGDLCLNSVKREANLSGLEELNIEKESGYIKINEKMQTNIDSIYAVGDVTGKCMLAHVAYKMGEIAALNVFGEDEKINIDNVSKCIYTVPQIASIGLREDDIKTPVKIGKFSLGANGKALADSKNQGFVKVICDARYNEILGIHIYGDKASEIINVGSVLKQLEIPADEGANLIFAHPTLSEVIKEALGDVDQMSLHLPKK